jgi:hypothetical protein
MHTYDNVLQTTQRAQSLRAEALRIWWQAQAARQLLAGGQQRYAQLMRKHRQMLAEIHQVLADTAGDRAE